MMDLGVHIITEFMGLKSDAVWDLLQQSHPELLSGTRVCDFWGSVCTLDAVANKIQKHNKPHFGVSFDDNGLIEISYGHIRDCEHSLLVIDGLVSDFADAQEWVAPFASCPGFREAWVFDMEFDHWQNAYDPLQYEAEGRSFEGLPMKSNDLPFPLEQTIIDTSANPGRRELRQGYVEAVGAVMWLGEQFWQVTGTQKENVFAQDWLTCDEGPSGVLRIQVSDKPFTSSEGEEGKIQDRLRALLFRAVPETNSNVKPSPSRSEETES